MATEKAVTIMSMFMGRTTAGHPGVFACGCCILYRVCRWWVRLSLESAERIVGLYIQCSRAHCSSVFGVVSSHCIPSKIRVAVALLREHFSIFEGRMKVDGNRAMFADLI